MTVVAAKLETMVQHALDGYMNKEGLELPAEEVAIRIVESDENVLNFFHHTDPIVRVILVRACVARWKEENKNDIRRKRAK